MLVRHVYQNVHTQGYRRQLGIGDFIRGSLVLLRLCKKLGYKFEVYLYNHPVSAYFVPQNEDIGISPDSVTSFMTHEYSKLISFLTLGVKGKKEVNLLSNPVTQEKPTEEDLQEIKRYFVFRPEFLDTLQLPTEPYSVVHIRLGDNGMFKGETGEEHYPKILLAIKEQVKEKPEHVYAVSDNQQVKEFLLKETPLRVSYGTWISHTGVSDDPTALEDTLAEFNLLANAQKIYQYSVYSWGSGFSGECARLHSIPLVKLNKVKPPRDAP